MPKLRDLLKVIGYDPIRQKKIWYEIRIPSIDITLEAKDDKNAFKMAEQSLNDLIRYFLLNPKYLRIKRGRTCGQKEKCLPPRLKKVK